MRVETIYLDPTIFGKQMSVVALHKVGNKRVKNEIHFPFWETNTQTIVTKSSLLTQNKVPIITITRHHYELLWIGHFVFVTKLRYNLE